MLELIGKPLCCPLHVTTGVELAALQRFNETSAGKESQRHPYCSR